MENTQTREGEAKASHTPGPWYADEGGRYVVDAEGKPIVASVSYWTIRNGEAAPNARLMAAAPELLAACHAALGIADITGLIWETQDTPNGDWSNVKEMLRAAIAKAEGGTQ